MSSAITPFPPHWLTTYAGRDNNKACRAISTTGELCAGLCVQGYVCRAMCAGLCVQGYVCRAMCARLCVQSYVYRAVCAGICVQGFV